MIMFKPKKAFTLIELLVVIAIIGILATISVIALTNARAKSRDAKRAGDMKQIQTALELFFNDKGRYPSASEWSTGKIFSTTTNATSSYMQIIPTAPTPADGACTANQNTITYTPAEDGSSYAISFCLGGNTGILDSGAKCLTPGGIIDVDCSGAAASSFTLTYTAGSNGSITGTSPQTVASGGSGSAVTAVAGSGYHFVNWSDASTANPRTDTNVLANVAVTANFALTSFACGGTLVDSRDGQSYATVNINGQCWFKENINIGTIAEPIYGQGNFSAGIQKYCYNDHEINPAPETVTCADDENCGGCDTDGGLYQWHMAAGKDSDCDLFNSCYDYPTDVCCTVSATDICPDGWHVPTTAEFKTLIEGLATPDCEVNSTWSCSPAGADLMVGGLSEFDNLMVGWNNVDRSYYHRGAAAYLWTSTPWAEVHGDPQYAWNRVMVPANDTVYKGKYRQDAAMPVRCIMD
jgi:uncharacterized protein (TIGR02145 family)/prepilin-type N-terminal cleavage/methylation domain-containing protein